MSTPAATLDKLGKNKFLCATKRQHPSQRSARETHYFIRDNPPENRQHGGNSSSSFERDITYIYAVGIMIL
jgi:hypothetical protein